MTLTTFFDFYFRWGFVENRKAWSNSLTNTMTFLFSCTSQAQVEIAISRCFQDRILRRVTRTSGPCCRLPPNPYFFWLRHLKLYYHANQIWHVCNNLLDAMVQVPMVKKEFSNVERRENLTTAQGEQRNDNVVRMCYSFAWHSFWSTVFGEKRLKFFFYSWLVSFSSFLFFYRREKDVSNCHLISAV